MKLPSVDALIDRMQDHGRYVEDEDAEDIREYGTKLLEAAAEVVEKYRPIERSDEVAERIRKLVDDL